jgi:hypothetical protein
MAVLSRIILRIFGNRSETRIFLAGEGRAPRRSTNLSRSQTLAGARASIFSPENGTGRCSHGAVSPCCGATAPVRLGTARRLQLITDQPPSGEATAVKLDSHHSSRRRTRMRCRARPWGRPGRSSRCRTNCRRCGRCRCGRWSRGRRRRGCHCGCRCRCWRWRSSRCW